MGQTLTHGIYLPDEGERNCYSGLAANWQLLDGAVGTVAEHTSQIAGKAPAVHTHTKADITDFPVYGTTAGTVCEGNDSRLSDARTPVAHTHTKSDVTDLFNSANEWTGNNVYSGISFPTLRVKNTSLDISSLPATNLGMHIDYLDKNNVVVSGWNYIKGPNGTTRLYVELATKDSNNHEIRRTLRFDTDQNGTNWKFYPSADTDLGTSTNKWKSLNGINPGALSLPDYTNALDVTSEIPVASLDGNTQIDINNYLPNKTGWLSIVIADTAGNFIVATQGRSGGSTAYNNSRTFHTGAQSNGYISVFFPILADMNKFVSIKASSLIQMRFYYCLGNV